MANTDNLDLKRLDGPKTTKFDYDLYVENNFEKVDAAVGAPPSTLTTEAKTLVPAIIELQSDKVDKETGKGLSTNDFSNEYKEKIDTDIPAQLNEKVHNFKFKNEVPNSGFDDIVNAWLPIGTGASLNIQSGKGIVAATGPASGVYLNIQGLSGDKFYVKAEYKSLSTACRLRINQFDSTAIIKDFVASTTTPITQSDVVQTTTAGIRLYLRNDNAGQSEWDNIITCNLSKTFGVGNEPTKLEMDELMKVIPDQWWDGELSLTQKQYMTWQLNLIRKNTNAIIALGGTII